jgi:D-alanyl-lipoteichoic acid acyltransferase DltB (MBOAT superfamily)
MLFNSIDFAIFLPIVFAIYWVIGSKNRSTQNLLLVGASYFFYGWWDWRFLSLILFSTLVDYGIGLLLNKQEEPLKRKLLLWTSIGVNLGFLGFFKYYNFFLDNFKTAFTFFGSDINASSLQIILPVGISFYTFQTLSYSIDIYRKKLKPTHNFIEFAAFVSFFPQLVAGPIERATHLLPQFQKSRVFDYHKAVNGLQQILWGLFKKIVIADNCAQYANIIFNNSDAHSGSTLVLGAVFFTFQIYGDFSGYSDIAIVTSRLFGFDLKRNFAFPYFSRDIAEFWRRWHISLSTWFRDYLYIPLGGSRGSKWVVIRNVFIIFIVSGFWHGANWTFIIWGALNAFYFLPLLLTNRNRNHQEVVAYSSWYPSIREVGGMLLTFGLTVFAWIFFRSNSLTHAWSIIRRIASKSLFRFPVFDQDDAVKPILLLIIIFMMIEWLGRRGEFAIDALLEKWRSSFRYLFYYAVLVVIFWFGGQEQEFIYFQF